MLLNLELIFLCVGVIGYPVALFVSGFVEMMRFLITPRGKELLLAPDDRTIASVNADLREFGASPSRVRDVFHFVTLAFRVNIFISVLGVVVFFLLGL